MRLRLRLTTPTGGERTPWIHLQFAFTCKADGYVVLSESLWDSINKKGARAHALASYGQICLGYP